MYPNEKTGPFLDASGSLFAEINMYNNNSVNIRQHKCDSSYNKSINQSINPSINQSILNYSTEPIKFFS